MDKLADELLKEFLSPPLRVPDHMFADTGMVSPFSKATSSASAVLLVCKRWMRVGTPALYETVIIRSSAQAQALQLALTNNPEFGRFVRKLRLEGAYGGFITSLVVESMSRVTDFCFTLSVFSSDKLSGLTKALNTFDPKRVVLTLHDSARARNAQHKALAQKLSAAIQKWTKLEHFCFAAISPFNRFNAESSIVPALSECKTLRTVDLWPMWIGYTVPSKELLEKLLANPSVRTVVLRSATAFTSSEQMTLIASLAPETLRRVMFAGPGRSVPVPFQGRVAPDAVAAVASNPFYTPMCTTPRETRLQIWGEIFACAVLKDSIANAYWESSFYSSRSPWFKRAHFDVGLAKALLTVSRDFHEALLPVLFRHLAIKHEAHVQTCASMLRAYPHLALDARAHSLELGSGPSAFLDDDRDALQDLLGLLSTVQKADINPFMPTLFGALSSLGAGSGRTLRKLTLSCPRKWSESLSLSFFADYSALQELHVNFEHARFTMSPDAGILPNLKDIHVHRVPASFFSSLSKASLPNLRSLSMHATFRKADGFVKRHGHKIETLFVQKGLLQENMDSMPALTSLSLAEEVKPEELAPLRHERLQQLRLNWTTGRPKSVALYQTTGSLLSAARFPALTELVVARKSEIWPATERDIKKSPWPALSTALAARGLTVVDHTGRAWRPRLQVQP